MKGSTAPKKIHISRYLGTLGSVPGVCGYPGAALFCYPGAAREGENDTPVPPYSVTPGPPGIWRWENDERKETRHQKQQKMEEHEDVEDVEEIAEHCCILL